jgi:ribose transport system permease protein
MNLVTVKKDKVNVTTIVSWTALVILIVVLGIFSPRFLLAGNISDLLENLSPLLVAGCGMAFVLLTGSIDLSIGSVCTCASMVMSVCIINGLGVLSYFAGIAFGLLAGFINGVLVSKLKIPSFIGTLGTMSVWSSVALLISDAPLLVPKKSHMLIAWVKVKLFGIIPLIFIVAIVILIIFYFVQKSTKYGHYIYCVGANERTYRKVVGNASKPTAHRVCFGGSHHH